MRRSTTQYSLSRSGSLVCHRRRPWRGVKICPLAQAANPPSTTFVDSIDVVSDVTIPYDLRFFQSLDRIVQIELRLVRDKALIEPLKSIGIEKGKPFNPDVKTRDVHKEAAREGNA